MSLSLITAGSILICPDLRLRQSPSSLTISSSRSLSLSSSSHREISSRLIKVTAMERTAETISGGVPNNTMKLLFVEMGVGYDQHGYGLIQFFNFLLSKHRDRCEIWMFKNGETGRTWHLRRWRLVRMQFLPIRFLLLEEVSFLLSISIVPKLIYNYSSLKNENVSLAIPIETQLAFVWKYSVCVCFLFLICVWHWMLCVEGSIPGVSFGEMKLQIKLGVPRSLHHQLDLDKVKSIFP